MPTENDGPGDVAGSSTAGRAHAGGDPAAEERALLRQYDELRALARKLLVTERRNHTLGATALVHEAWLRLTGGDADPPLDPGEFRCMAMTAMRRVLLDHARRRGRAIRGSGRELIRLDAAAFAATGDFTEILAVDEAIQRLAETDAATAEVVRLRFYAGLTVDEVAKALDWSPRSVYRAWTFARAWLLRHLEMTPDDET